MNNKSADQTARMRRLVCAFVVRKPPKTGFLATRPSCFCFHYDVICLTNAYFYGFWCTNNPNPTAYSDVKCFLFATLCFGIQEASFDAIVDRYWNMIWCFFYLHIARSTPCYQVCKMWGFLIFILTFTSYFPSVNLIVK